MDHQEHDNECIGAMDRNDDFRTYANTDGLGFLIGIGASAGGLQSIERLISGLNKCEDSAVVIVQHLAPNTESHMCEILQRSTDIKIKNIEDGDRIEPNGIYLAPPGCGVRITGDSFELVARDRKEFLRPVDEFFESLADQYGRRAIAVVLSGSGVDGAKGVQAIRLSGGVTLVESFETAEFDSMPRSCNKTGCVDAVLRVPEISHWINQQIATPATRPEFERLEERVLEGLELIFSLLSTKYKIDFADYKPTTILRRMERRQQFCDCDTVLEYAEYVRETPGELDDLYGDLLIGVTKFFRDTDAFELIERCLDDIVRNLPEGETLRIWSAGCASGEEAYSLAMLAYQCLERHGRPCDFKVFATDIDNRSLNFASRGKYQKEAMEFVSAELKHRFFDIDQDQNFRIKNHIRRNIVFAFHNVYQDPPFTRLHLVCCRNMLIYLRNEMQQKAVKSFLFSLVTDGTLVLGKSETLGLHGVNFRVVDSTWRVYQKIEDISLQRKPLTFSSFQADDSGRRLINFLNNDQPSSLSFTKLVDSYELLLERLVKRGILVDENRNILHVVGDAAKYLGNQVGRFSGSVTELLSGDARIAITAGLLKAAKSPKETVCLAGIAFPHLGEEKHVKVNIRALGTNAISEKGWIIEFIEDAEVSENEVVTISELDFSGHSDLKAIEAELSFTKDNLSATIEELEASNEELNSTNEELIASNEELQSTNEELQSVNEELVTVNHENNRKIDELQELSNDLEFVVNNSDVGTLFLNHDLSIRKYTNQIRRHFGLMPGDIGRPIDNFRSKLMDVNFLELLEQVRESGTPFSKIVKDSSDVSVMLRIQPYSYGKEASGLVVNISDRILKLGDGVVGDLELSENCGYWYWPDLSQENVWWSPTCYELLGIENSEEGCFSTLLSRVHEDDSARLKNLAEEPDANSKLDSISVRFNCGDDQIRIFSIHIAYRLVKDGVIAGLCGYLESVTD